MDAQALLTPDAVEHEMGRPLAHVPDQAGDGHASYARHHAQALHRDVLGSRHPPGSLLLDERDLRRPARWIRTSGSRSTGPTVVREIYRRVANVQHPDEWHPVQVVCENCGKIGTTIVTKWDGERVFYECRANLVTWARGCGTPAGSSPFGGRAKLGWNLEWAAQWSLFGVTIEPCGKDLRPPAAARERADAIAREVFEREPPLNVPYEFLNIGGRKMSTSKGRGAAAHEIVEVVPPEQLRFLFLRPRPNSAIEFDPEGTDAIPRLFDEFDRVAAATAGREVKGELPPVARVDLPLLAADPDADVAAEAAAFRPAFAHLALLVQIPGSTSGERVAAEKGAPLTAREAAILAERVAAARRWLDTYAPERARIAVRTDALPAEASPRSRTTQRAFLGALADGAPSRDARRRRDGLAGADLRDGRRARAARRPRVRRDLSRVPRSPERPARRLAAGRPRAASSSSSACGRRGGQRMASA